MSDQERQTGSDYPQVDTSPTEHERRVAEESEAGSGAAGGMESGRGDDPTTDPGRRPSADEDLRADMTPGDES